ncbi:MAG: hypothetical protein QW837_09135 [Conexivisphaerales archaeon]
MTEASGSMTDTTATPCLTVSQLSLPLLTPMKRMNEEVKDREKVIHGLERMYTPILKGVQLYHNFIKLHKGFQGRTPAEAAGIKI